MMPVTIALHTPFQTSHHSIHAPSCNNDLSVMTTLFEQELHQQDSSYKVGGSKRTHLFVANLETQRSGGVTNFAVYVIKAHREVSRLDEVINLATSTYPDVFVNVSSEMILKGFPPKVMECPENTFYPCGTIFTLKPSQSGSSDQQPSTLLASHEVVSTLQGERGDIPFPESLDWSTGNHQFFRNSFLTKSDQHCTQFPQYLKSHHNDVEQTPETSPNIDEGRLCGTGVLIIASEETSSSSNSSSKGDVASSHGAISMEGRSQFGSTFPLTPDFSTQDGMEFENQTKAFTQTEIAIVKDNVIPLDVSEIGNETGAVETTPAPCSYPSPSSHASTLMAQAIPERSEQDWDGQDECIINSKIYQLPSSKRNCQKEEEVEYLQLAVDDHGIGLVTLREVQLLEDAYNGTCADKEACKLEHNTLSFCEYVDQMANLVQQLENGCDQLLVNLRPAIRHHCSGCRCRGAGCNVPHMAAGCLPPIPSLPSGNNTKSASLSRDRHTPSTPSNEIHNPSFSPSLTGILDVSFDSQVPAFCSITPENGNSLKIQNASNDDLLQTIEEEVVGVVNQVDHVMPQQEVDVPGATCTDHFGTSVQVYRFSDISVYKNLEPGRFIYTTKEHKSLRHEYQYHLPNLKRNAMLGEGGFGQVFDCVINSCAYAVKKTKLRPSELNVWIKLNHPNLTRLLAVMVDPREKICYQFMHRMAGSLDASLRKHGCLNVMFQRTKISPGQRRNIVYNFCYVLKGVLKGLEYLHSINIQHCDIKGSNVLIGKCTCNCSDFLYCTCPEDSKCQVWLSDFDSVMVTKQPRKSSKMPVVLDGVKRRMVFGTPGCRAPEQFRVPLEQKDCFARTIVNGRKRTVVDFDGPWSDNWSFGFMVLQACMGKINIIPRTHITAATLDSLRSLTEAAEKVWSLAVLAALCNQCLTLEFRARPTASELLEWLEAAVANEIL